MIALLGGAHRGAGGEVVEDFDGVGGQRQEDGGFRAPDDDFFTVGLTGKGRYDHCGIGPVSGHCGFPLYAKDRRPVAAVRVRKACLGAGRPHGRGRNPQGFDFPDLDLLHALHLLLAVCSGAGAVSDITVSVLADSHIRRTTAFIYGG